MDYCREHIPVSPAAPGEANTFIADMLQPRPDFDKLASFRTWAKDASDKMSEAMKRKGCPVSWVQLVVDQQGFLALLKFRHDVQICNAKLAAKAILNFIEEDQRRIVQQKIRPLDEADRDRLAEWVTIESLQPKGQKRKRSEEEEPQPSNKQARHAEVAQLVAEGVMKAPTLEEYMAQASSDEESEAELEPPRLMLTDGATSAALAPLNYDDPASLWEHRVKTEATIVLAEAGTRPEALKFIRCHREDRRQILLQSRVNKGYDNPTLQSVVRVAMQLAKEGAIPGVGDHGRRSEFIKRCASALASLDPDAEGVLTSLSIREQALIRSALGGEGPPYEGCFSEQCMDKEPSWTERDLSLPNAPRMVLSRCSRCNMPKSYGRTFSMRALVDGFEPKGRPFHNANRQ